MARLGHDDRVIRGMGVYREGQEIAVDGISDAIYDAPKVGEARHALERAREVAEADGDAFVWVGLFQPTKAELAVVGSVFDLDAHQLEDAGNSHQRAKVDLGRQAAFVLVKVLTYQPETHEVDVGQVSVFVGPHYVVTVRHGTTRDLRELRDRVARRPDVLVRGPYGLLHAVVDQVVDGYLVVGEQVQAAVEELEERVFSPRPADLSGAIYMLKRENLEIRRTVHPLLSVAGSMMSERLPHVPEELASSFRDIGEHLLRVAEQAESTDGLLLALMAAANAKVDLLQSADQRRMAAWAALALIPTVIGSLYGMNFVYMPELEWRWGYPAVLLLIVVTLTVVYRRFRGAGWL